MCLIGKVCTLFCIVKCIRAWVIVTVSTCTCTWRIHTLFMLTVLVHISYYHKVQSVISLVSFSDHLLGRSGDYREAWYFVLCNSCVACDVMC